jgi:hypothetical protein
MRPSPFPAIHPQINEVLAENADEFTKRRLLDLAANYDKRLTLVDPHRPRALIAPLHLTETQKQI